MLDSFTLDVVGIGALNIDYTVHASAVTVGEGHRSLPLGDSIVVPGSPSPFEWGTESVVDEKTIDAALEDVSTASLDATLGGSAFNAIFALARMKLGARLGYVGVAGRVPIPGLSSLQQLDLLQIDRRFVRSDNSRPCGICFSFIKDGERTLLTHPGANVEMAGMIEAEFNNLVAYLSTSRVLHITSFLDEETPRRLLELLQAVKAANPRTLISFDPGHPWASAPTEAVEGLLHLSDYILINYREFRLLGGYESGDQDDIVAERIFDRVDSGDAALIVKRNDGILSFRSVAGSIVAEHFAHIPLPESDIRDATGAGDVFAAGLLAVITGAWLQVELGSFLGMALAKHKLSFAGVQGHAQFPEITRGFIRSRDAERRQISLPRGVFISHGRDSQWRSVKAFIEEECGLPVYAFESDAWESRQVTDALSRYMDKCSFAVCVLSGEDLTQDGRKRARQNVLHEAGLFQGRYGFDRVMLFVEEGCEVELDAIGLSTITFRKDAIDSTFWRLQKMIRTQGFVRSL